MKVTRSNKFDGNIATNSCSYLTQIKDHGDLFFSQEHSLKHPLAIYNISARSFFEAYNILIDAVNSQKKGNPLKLDFYLPTIKLA